MENLPEEILVDLLDYLEPKDLLPVQQTSSRLSRIARGNQLWKSKCFESSPSASMRLDANILSTLTGALQGLSLSDETSPLPPAPSPAQSQAQGNERSLMSRRARALQRWDLSAEDEIVDWYSEYKGRNAPLSMEWLAPQAWNEAEIRGISTFDHSTKAIGYLEDSSIRIWDLSENVYGRRKFAEVDRAKPSVLTAKLETDADTLVVDCMSTLDRQQKTYLATGNTVNEIDLTTLTVLARFKYGHPITALSQASGLEVPLTVGTNWSLHILDPRIPIFMADGGSGSHLELVPETAGDTTAILPDLSKSPSRLPPHFGARQPSVSPLVASATLSSSPSWTPSSRLQNPELMAYAQIEPGPLSILHHSDHEILAGGRFPTILSYDRRYFPHLQYVIHSSASLSSLAAIPHPPAGAPSNVTGTSTLVACGEYRGRGSLELYSLPHIKAENNNGSPNGSGDGLYSYKNRQQAAKSKILSVAPHGTKIVFSDSDGGLKWVERDGHSLVRRWNIRDFQVGSGGAALSGTEIARKIIPLATPDSERGQRGDGDLLVWTGETFGIVTTKPEYADHEELVKEFENLGIDEGKEEREKEEEYARTMRLALERQADERRWMSRFRLRSRHF